MFCSNCGAEITGIGKFCSSCGIAVETEIIEDDNIKSNDLIVDANGIEINMTEIYRKYRKEKVNAIKNVMEISGLNIKEAKKIVDSSFEELKINFIDDAMSNSEKEKIINNQNRKNNIEKAQQESVACCPKCGSTSLTAQKKGFGIGKAVVGASLTGGIGLVAGNLGAKKVRVTCLNCGKQFWAGKK
ncbi:TPA: ribosomal protein L7/L12 [Clostridioides difficile]|uniref:ribosomal protein L7/L12 n=1 Tax=Clostridioides difficile TaxID=1496 RepID=UPI0008250C9D|nr:ribosomal protein L7/L12 [Clostridioides difficile]EGT4532738.1 zinc ribbon domain-containing protein [Clostridioides difficile]EGT4654250.1 zinc ribbon domain-containing protein [Clostridioides difficile]EGT5505544.1 zinc ribbon domain-containing protein [Clostridioides difficile]EIS9421782.1 ribosomal protein L7/L12 [Clostridioides difficile]EIS9443258.1 ribosomal protein L7/L12 [Clostridioides difficile]